METKPSKPRLPLKHVPGQLGGEVVDGRGWTLATPEVAWLSNAAEAHGPALKAMREWLPLIEEAFPADDEPGFETWAAAFDRLHAALALMEKAPEPTP